MSAALGKHHAGYLPWLLAASAFVLRLATRAHVPTEWDSVQLLLGIDNFDITQHSPHPPGYWLYVAAARMTQAVLQFDGHTSLVILAALASSATVGIVYLLGRDLFGTWAAIGAAAYLATVPTSWFYGSIAASYSFDALASAALMLLAWRAKPNSPHPYAAAATIGLAAGLRPTTLLLLGPIAAISALRSVRSVKQGAITCLVGVACIGVWIIPMALEQPGGYGAIRQANREIFVAAVHNTSILFGVPTTAWLNNMRQATGYTLAAVAPIVLVSLVALLCIAGARLLASPEKSSQPRRKLLTFTPAYLLLTAATPAVAFSLLLHFSKAGYILAYLPAAILLAVWPLKHVDGAGRAIVASTLAVACLFNTMRFLSGEGVLPLRFLGKASWLTQENNGAPYRTTLHEINKIDKETRAYMEIANRFSPPRDVLVYVWMNGGHRFRHTTWSLPQFDTKLLHDGVEESASHNGNLSHERDAYIEVPPGGRAVFVLDTPTPEIDKLSQQGKARVEILSTAVKVWTVDIGSRIFGAQVVEKRVVEKRVIEKKAVERKV